MFAKLLSFQTNVINKSTSIYQPSSTILTFVFYHLPLDKNFILIPILFNTLLLDFKTNKDKNKKNVAINFCHFSKNNFFNRNLSKANNDNNRIFSNNKNKEKFILTSEKTK